MQGGKFDMQNKNIFKTFVPAIIFISTIWIVFWIEQIYNFELYQYGLYPKKLKGLIGIITMPFIHGDFKHLINNSIPLFVLITFLFYFFRKHFFKVFILLWLLNGLWTWILARESYHIGASGLVYAFSSFLFFAGIILKDKKHIALSLLIVFLYGSMVWGLFPIDFSKSWEGHLTGFMAGIIIAYYYKSELIENYGIKLIYEEDDDENDEDDDNLGISNTNNTYSNYHSNSTWTQKP